MIDLQPRYLEILKVHPNYSVVYKEWIEANCRTTCEKSLGNLTANQHKGELSRKAILRLQTSLEWLLLIAKRKKADNLKSNSVFNFKVSMLTLTLPCQQLHDDLYIKKMLLNEFLTIVRKKYNLQNYIWKAEKQQNGSIHFHIIIDKYIFYKDINTIWNNILNTHGYIDKYRENQQNKHINGFYYDQKNSIQWNKSKQLAAYKRGVHTNWRHPTGTTDIHSLKKIRNAKSYLSKYITKNPDVSKKVNAISAEYCRNNNVQHVPPSKLEEITTAVKRQLSVLGNLWYISRSLSELKGIKIEITNEIGKELNSFRFKNVKDVIYKDYCAIYNFSIKDIFKYKYQNLCSKVKDYILTLRDLFYPPGEIVSSPLGLPLNIFDL